MHKELKSRLIWMSLSLGLLAAISLLLIIGIYQKNPRDPLSAVPSSAKAVILIRGQYFFGSSELNRNAILSSFTGWPRLNTCVESLVFLDSLAKTQSERFNGLKSTNMVFAPVLVQDEIHALMIADAVSGLNEKRWKNLLEMWGTEVTATGQASGFTYERNGQRIYVGFSHNLILVSSSQAAIGLARETLTRPFKNDFLNKALATAGSKVAATLFLPNELLEEILLLPFPGIRKATQLPTASPGWTSFDITLKDEDLLLTGYLDAQTELMSWLQWFSSPPLDKSIPTNIARDASAFIHFSSLPINFSPSPPGDIPDSTVYSGDQDNQDNASLTFLHFNNLAPYPIEAAILQYPEHWLTPDNNPMKKEEIASYAGLPTGMLELATYHAHPFLFFSTDSAAIPLLVNNLDFGRKLISAPWFENFSTNLPDLSGCWSRMELSQETDWYAIITGDSGTSSEARPPIISLDWAVRAGNSPFITMHISTGKALASGKKKHQALLTEAAIALPPTPVWDHTNKVYNLLVFDSESQAYLFSPTGEQLWKRSIDGIPLGGAEMVDLLKNGKIQYVFNTATSIYAVDLNGKDVPPFPLTLPATATNSVAALDYEKKRDYRFLIALEGGRIYNFGKDGKKTQGWKEPRLKSPVHEKITCITIDGKDFIIIPDASGQVLMCGRRGETRIQIQKAFKNAPQSAFYLSGTNKNKRLLTTSIDGKLQIISSNGRISSVALEETTSDHRITIGNYTGDGDFECIVQDAAWIRTYSMDGKNLFEIPAISATISNPVLIPAPSRTLLAVTETTQGIIHLFEFGNAEPVIKLPGAFPPIWVDLNQDDEFELVTASGKEILIHRLE